jgi:hypothetical protein
VCVCVSVCVCDNTVKSFRLKQMLCQMLDANHKVRACLCVLLCMCVSVCVCV